MVHHKGDHSWPGCGCGCVCDPCFICGLAVIVFLVVYEALVGLVCGSSPCPADNHVAAGEVCGPHGAGPGEGVLAPERDAVSRHLHHRVPPKVPCHVTLCNAMPPYFSSCHVM